MSEPCRRVLNVCVIGMALCGGIWTSTALAGDTDTSQNPATATPTEWQANYRSAGNRPGSGMGNMLREGPTGGIWQRSQLLGDPLGLRAWLSKYGATLNIQETSEYLGNVTGGIKKGFDYDGLATIALQVNTKRAFNHYGGLINVSALEVHGDNLSNDNLRTLQTGSGIEADNGLRLWELWYQEMFLYNQIDIKLGNQSLDQEFLVSQYAGLFVNTMFGWPMLTSADLLSGGPAYPLASLGARFRAQPSGEPWTFLLGAFDDNPAGVNPQAISTSDPQQLNGHGTNMRLNDNPLLIAEIQYSRPAVGQIEYANHQPILPGTYKLGFWYDTGKFPDQRYGTDGQPLASGNGIPSLHQSNFSLYAVVDQLLWRRSAESPEGVAMFVRVMGAPGAQNPVDFSYNAGLTWHAPIQHREYDTVGVGMGGAHVSDRLRAADQDGANASGTTVFSPIRSSETFVEMTYQYQVVPWWQLQPDIQYVFNPGAGIVNPNNPSQAIANELVVGLRTNIVF